MEKTGFSAPIKVLLGQQMTYRAETWDSGSPHISLHIMSELDPQLERNFFWGGGGSSEVYDSWLLNELEKVGLVSIGISLVSK